MANDETNDERWLAVGRCITGTLIGHDPALDARVTATTLQAVGSKGYDGLTTALVRGAGHSAGTRR